MTERIRIMLVKRGNMSESELARKIGTSPQNLHNKFKRNNFSTVELEEIAAALGVERSEVVFAMDAICDPVSLYEPVYTASGESIAVIDQVGDSKNTAEHWLM